MPKTSEPFIRKVLNTEVKYLIAVVIFIFGVIKPYFDIRQEIALIRENHFAHLERLGEQIEATNEKYTELKESNNKRDELILSLIKEK